MEILHSYEHISDKALATIIFLLIFTAIMMIVAICATHDKEAVLPVILAAVTLVFVVVVLTCVPPDKYHEVTLRDDHVIDATKYEIIEQRGQIYVIREREASE